MSHFKEADLAFVVEFHKRANLWGEANPHLESVDEENDSICFGCWTVTATPRTETVQTLVTYETRTVIDYVCTAEVTTHSCSHWEPDDTDVQEFGRSRTFYGALKLCAIAELNWEMDQWEFPLQHDDEESY